MKYKVGEKVRVIGQKSGNGKIGYNSKMDKWIGEIVTIRHITDDGSYKIKEDENEYFQSGWYWDEEWLEPITNTVTREDIKKFILNKLGLKVGDKFNIKDSLYNPYIVVENYAALNKHGNKINLSYCVGEEITKIEEPKKYCWKLKGFSSDSYLNYVVDRKLLTISDNIDDNYFKTKFAEEEVKELANKHRFKLSAFEKEEIN